MQAIINNKTTTLSPNMDRDTYRISVLIFGMYVAAITLTMYNKWMFDPNRTLHIAYPLFVTSTHQAQLWVISYIYLRWKGHLTPQNLNHGDWKYYLKYIIPIAIATAGDIGLGNISFKYVPFTVYTIVKSSTIAFVLFFGCLFKVEVPSWRLFVIVLTMFIGVVLMGLKPVNGHGGGDTSSTSGSGSETLGVILVVISSALGGFRWVYVQVILNHKKNTFLAPPSDNEMVDISKRTTKKNPVITLHQLALPMSIMLFTTSLLIERPFPGIFKSELMQWENHSTPITLLRGAGLLILPSFLVFMLTICEFGILQIAPVLTLSITGIIKELFTVFLGMLVFKETLGLYNWMGMAVVLVGVCYYNYYRFKQRIQSDALPGDYNPVAADELPETKPLPGNSELEQPSIDNGSGDSATAWEMDFELESMHSKLSDNEPTTITTEQTQTHVRND